jgi:hypothetical protein
MIAIIPDGHQDGYERGMDGRDSNSAITVVGTGEFQRKDRHVIATVEMHDEVISGLGFTCVSGEELPEATDLVSLLTGRDVNDALRLLAADREAGDKGESEGREVLIEAFHRAVETCLDQQ